MAGVKIMIMLVLLVGTVAQCAEVKAQFEEEIVRRIEELASMVLEQGLLIDELRNENQDQSSVVLELLARIDELLHEKQQQERAIEALLERLGTLENNALVNHDTSHLDNDKDLALNVTIEERVAFLEVQVAEIDEDIDFLFEEQVIVDQRLLSLEQINTGFNQDLDDIDDDIEELENQATVLDFRVTILEENSGSDNGELEERVETLEGTAADQETRLNTTENEISDLRNVTQNLDNRATAVEDEVSDHETRLTSAEANIEALKMTDVNQEERISALEQNETIAFTAVLTEYDTIDEDSTVLFNEVVTNEGDGYNSSSGFFTVPPGGDGLYHFTTYLQVESGDTARFEIRVNNTRICTAEGDAGNNEDPQATCSAVIGLVEGDEVKVQYFVGNDNKPLRVGSNNYFSGFTGFRI